MNDEFEKSRAFCNPDKEQMTNIREGVYRCRICGTTIDYSSGGPTIVILEIAKQRGESK